LAYFFGKVISILMGMFIPSPGHHLPLTSLIGLPKMNRYFLTPCPGEIKKQGYYPTTRTRKMIQLTLKFCVLKARAVLLNPFGGDPVDHDHISYRSLSSSEQQITHQHRQQMGIHGTL